jgi:outer membrane protein assembly factor BamB
LGLSILIVILQAADAAQEQGAKQADQAKGKNKAPAKQQAVPPKVVFPKVVNPNQPPVVFPAQRIIGGQFVPPGASAGQANDLTDAITLPTDRTVKKRLEAAQDDYIKNESWAEACQLLQFVLDNKEDVFVQVKRRDADGQEKTHWVSAKAEANRLIGTMGTKGLEFYELQYGANAKTLLAEANKKSDPQLLAEVAERFFHTEAGTEATDLLATYRLDRGDALMAALRYQRLLQRHGAEQLSPLTLFKATVAFRLCGDEAFREAAEASWRQLVSKAGRDGLRVDDENVSLEQLKHELGRIKVAEASDIYDWPLPRGNASHTARAPGGAPFLKKKWQKSLFPDDPQSETRAWVEDALQQPYRPEAMLPAFYPIAVGGKLLYRSYSGVHARVMKTGETWDSARHTASLHALATEHDYKHEVHIWFKEYVRQNQNIIFENSVNGTLSSDNARVYAVDDIAVPPLVPIGPGVALNMNNGGSMNAKLKNLVERSRLVAMDLSSEQLKIVWERGDHDKDPSELKDNVFLGPPLPLGGKLYVLSEKNRELRLNCLDAPKGELLWSQTLAHARDPIQQDVSRRIQAVHLAYGEGILVCPTNAGAILGVDLLSHSLVWAFPYRERSPDPAPMIGGAFPPRPGRRFMAQPFPGQDILSTVQKSSSDWKFSAPIIHDGKVVFTGWEPGSSIHCLNLRDGNAIWHAERRDDLYVACVFQGTVVLVGKNTCRALSLSDGKPLWQVAIDPPSGQGAASGRYYFLPLKKGEVCQIDLEKGRIVAHSASPDHEVPGNLLFYDGEVFSQTETTITCYPLVDFKEAEITNLLQKKPKDPDALTERGELRLYRGDLAGAVADLRDAVKNQPSSSTLRKARAKLYDTLTDLMRQNFNAAEQYLDEYKELCKIEIPAGASTEERKKLMEEERRRRSHFLYSLAEGRVNQGRLSEAFQAYLDFGAVAGTDELVNVTNDPAVKARPDIWAQGRIAALVAKATPDERKLLEAEIAKRWAVVQKSNDLESLRRFVASFGKIFAVGREARLLLAERLIEAYAYLEAECHLLQLRQQSEEPRVAGRAVEALARLMTRRGLLEDAAYYYRILRRDFAKVIIRDGKTGADIFNELDTDKRFLPYLDEVQSSLWSPELTAIQKNGGLVQRQYRWVLKPRGEVLPFFERNRLVWYVTNINSNCQLKLVNDENREEWELTSPTRIIPNLPSINQNAPCFVKGHLAVLYLGHTLYGIDFIGRRKLWEKNLLTQDLQRLEQFAQQLMWWVDDRGGLYLASQLGLQKTLGQIGSLTASYLCLRTSDGLVGLDPLRGTVLWTRSGVSSRTEIFGDDEYIYIVEFREDRSVGTTLALRGSDGSTVADVPDFSQTYQHRLRPPVDGRLLVSESDSSGGTLLRLYDVRKGEDLWRKSLPAGSLILRVEEPELAATLTPDGQLAAVDLRTQRELLTVTVKREHLEKVSEGLFLRDPFQYYLALNAPERNGNAQTPTPNFSGLSKALVNKVIYAFRWDDAKAKWTRSWYDDRLANQALLLERFRELPMVFLSTRYREPAKDAGLDAFTNEVATIVINKRTGTRILKKPEPEPVSTATGPFHTLEIDNRNAQVLLFGDRIRVVHYVGDSPPKDTFGQHTKRGFFQYDDRDEQAAPVQMPNLRRVRRLPD